MSEALPPFSRRHLLGAVGGLATGAVVLGGQSLPAGATQVAAAAEPATADAMAAVVPFYGRHQAGVLTPPQRLTSFATFDVQTDDRDELTRMLRTWSEVAATLCAGRSVGAFGDARAVEPDSGAAVGLGPARLTVTFGFGPGLFGLGGPDRFGLRARWPLALVPLPQFPGDSISSADTGGDLTVQACADDPQVAFHALWQIARAAGDSATIRWMQAGFNEAAVATGTPRNLLGFKDGTINPRTRDQLDEFVWVVDGQEQPWMWGGTYLVVRRIRVLAERWASQTLADQERIIGRHKQSGAPLGKAREHDTLDLERRTPQGDLVIPADAHVRLTAPSQNWDQMLLRRSYAFDNGLIADADAAGAPALDSGLLLFTYQQNPRLAFIPIYQRLAVQDSLRHFTAHTASAIAAIPPGAPAPGHWVGEELLG
jgi:deferrochelatase/peroxidase EfeB